MESANSKYIDTVHLTEDGGVVKKIIREGEGEVPAANQEVTVHYKGELEDGSVFDSSYDQGEPLKFIIGAGHVIQGWEVGVMSMKLGEKAELVIGSKYGYGPMGQPPKIPGDATLVFTIEVLQIHDRRVTKWMMNDQERIAATLKLKEDGNLRFKAKKFKEAEGLYRDALSHLDTVENDNEEIQKLKKTLLTNMSVCTNSTQDWAETVRNCAKAVEIDAAHAKAHFLKGVAERNLHKYDDATVSIKTAIKLMPNDKKIREEFELLKEQKKKHSASEGNVFKAFLSEGIYNEKKAEITRKEYGLPAFDPTNPQVFMDIKIGEQEPQRVVFELFQNKTPLTAENFRALCTGEKGETDGLALHYKGNLFHRIIKDFMMQGGDFENENGTGGCSIYGRKFEDEKVWLPHLSPGLLSMANSGPNTNGSQFFVTFRETPHLDGKHTVFGRVIQGWPTVLASEKVETGAQDKPRSPVIIADCGELQEKLSEEDTEIKKIVEGWKGAPVTTMGVEKSEEKEEGEEEKGE